MNYSTVRWLEKHHNKKLHQQSSLDADRYVDCVCFVGEGGGRRRKKGGDGSEGLTTF